MPFSKSFANLVGAYGTELNTLFSHGLKTLLKLGPEGGERWWFAIRPRCPWKRMTMVWVVLFNWLCEVDVTGDMRPLVPVLEMPCIAIKQNSWITTMNNWTCQMSNQNSYGLLRSRMRVVLPTPRGPWRMSGWWTRWRWAWLLRTVSMIGLGMIRHALFTISASNWV